MSMSAIDEETRQRSAECERERESAEEQDRVIAGLMAEQAEAAAR